METDRLLRIILIWVRCITMLIPFVILTMADSFPDVITAIITVFYIAMAYVLEWRTKS